MTSVRGSGRQLEFSRSDALRALGLDVIYERAEGDQLFYRNPQEVAVWDFLGGYGSTFFGHNHPALTEAVVHFLARRGVVHGQASVRSASDELSAKLSDRLRAATGRPYRIVLANTGAEAVEVAAKHADLAYARKRDETTRWLGSPHEPEGEPVWTPHARTLLAELDVWKGQGTLAEIDEHNRGVLTAVPALIAVRGSFHGMTARALELTHDLDARFGVRISGSRVRFVEASSCDSLRELLLGLTWPLLRARPRGNAWDVETMDWTCASGFFMEPIQGEGGIHPIDAATAQGWQAICKACDVPLIADEIQSGMGRTGSFLYCEQLQLQPDYVLLGKSLGGGIAKISVVGVDADRYLEEFSLQHSSTFAEDDLSSVVGLRALELLEQEDVLAQASAKGNHLRRALMAVADRHPTVIEEIRGRGLMFGLQWREIDFDRSNALRLLQHYGWLGYALSGYLLKAHGLRVAPALSGDATLRLEPSYSVPDEAVQRLLEGLEELCTLLERQDAASILAPCISSHLTSRGLRASPPAVRRCPSPTSHVAFVGHFIDPDGLELWDPSLSRIGPQGRRSFLDRMRPMAEPLVYHRDHVRSATGEVTTLSFIGLPVTSEQCYGALRRPERRELSDLVQRAVDMATDDGCSVVGLGGYCSILTRNGKDLRPNGIAVTTGNGYTVGAGLLAMRATAEELGLTWECSRAAVIGATGNIGAVVARLLANGVRSLVLIGRSSRMTEMEACAGEILWDLAQAHPTAPMARALDIDCLGAKEPARLEELAEVYRRMKGMLGNDCPIDIGWDAAMCRGAQLVVAATNQPDAILFPEHVGDGPMVICDVSVPGDVDPSVATVRPNARVIRGGVVRTPENADWYVPGIPLRPGEMFACMAETALMGLEGHRSHGSFGSLTAERVIATIEMARRHGFTAVRTKLESSY